MIRFIVLACIISTTTACCFDANNRNLKLTPGDLAVGWVKEDYEMAELSCERMNGQLAIVDTQAKLDSAVKCVKQIAGDYEFARVEGTRVGGIRYDGVWQWSNGQNITKFRCTDRFARFSNDWTSVTLRRGTDNVYCVHLGPPRAFIISYLCEHTN